MKTLFNLFVQSKLWVKLIILFMLFLIIAPIVYQFPPVYDRLAWRIDAWKASIVYALNPPEEVIFFEGDEAAQLEAIVQATLLALTPRAGTAAPTITPTYTGPTYTPAPTFTPTITPTALPLGANLKGFRHQYQRWNNCGPATLSMGLSYWDWQGNQLTTAEYLKPNDRDKNVMPYEMMNYIIDETDLYGIRRVGGDLRLLKNLLANGYPVLVEKGFTGAAFDGWMGHYELVTGYDNNAQVFISQDSYMGPDYQIAFDRFEGDWQDFNYVFIVIFPPDKETEVLSLLGPWADEAWAVDHALELAETQINSVEGMDLFFAWFNKGSAHVSRFEYYDASIAFDLAFLIYNDLDVEERPWRMVWYQTTPYFAYYYNGNYNKVINLASTTLASMSEPVLEESFYWRGLAYEAIGETDNAISDYRDSVKLNTNFVPGYAALERLGVSP